MGKVEFSYYTDKDADLVADLLVRNKFGLGKFDRELNGEKLKNYFSENGISVGVVGKMDGKAVLFMDGYRKGGGRVCRDNQLLTTCLVIDSKFRNSITSVTEMFIMLTNEAARLGYNELISEVHKQNIPSLMFHQKSGYFAYDDEVTPYGNHVLHHFVPAIMRFMGCEFEINKKNVTDGLRPATKRKLINIIDYVADNIIVNRWERKIGTTDLFIDIETSNIIGVENLDSFKLAMDFENNKNIVYTCYDEVKRDIQVIYYHDKDELCSEKYVACESENASNKCYDGKSLKVSFEDNINRIVFRLSDEEIPYVFEKNIKYKLKNISKNIDKFSNISDIDINYNENIGALEISKDEKVLFKEMWSEIAHPYMEAVFNDYIKPNLDFEKLSDGLYKAKYDNGKYITTKEYDIRENEIGITTSTETKENVSAKPLHQFVIYNEKFDVKVYLENGEVLAYNEESFDMVYDEFFYHNFRNDDSSRFCFEKIEIIIQDKIYTIKTNEKLKCVVNNNYIAIYCPNSELNKNEKIILPKLSIKFGN